MGAEKAKLWSLTISINDIEPDVTCIGGFVIYDVTPVLTMQSINVSAFGVIGGALFTPPENIGVGAVEVLLPTNVHPIAILFEAPMPGEFVNIGFP